MGTVSARLPDDIEDDLAAYVDAERVDRSTAVRRLLAASLDVVTAVDPDRVIPERVYDEVVTAGLDAGHADVRRVERAVESGRFDVVPVDGGAFDRLCDNSALSAADAAVLALAADRDATAVVDERHGRAVADAEGIETHGTAHCVLAALRDGHLSADAARETVDDLLDAGWYCSPDLCARIVRTIEALA
jgi:predicted nucleic acid-binding protein